MITKEDFDKLIEDVKNDYDSLPKTYLSFPEFWLIQKENTVKIKYYPQPMTERELSLEYHDGKVKAKFYGVNHVSSVKTRKHYTKTYKDLTVLEAHLREFLNWGKLTNLRQTKSKKELKAIADNFIIAVDNAVNELLHDLTNRAKRIIKTTWYMKTLKFYYPYVDKRDNREHLAELHKSRKGFVYAEDSLHGAGGGLIITHFYYKTFEEDEKIPIVIRAKPIVEITYEDKESGLTDFDSAEAQIRVELKVKELQKLKDEIKKAYVLWREKKVLEVRRWRVGGKFLD